MGTQYAKPPLEPFQWARNGQYPDAYLQGELADLVNKTALYRLKEIGSFFADSGPDSPGGSGERPRWRCSFIASQYATCIIAKGWMATSTQENASEASYARIRIQDGTPTTLGDAELHYGASTVAASTPSVLAPIWTYVVSAPNAPAVPVAGTAYYVTVSDFQSRIWALSLYECSAIGGVAPQSEGYAQGTPIKNIDTSECVRPARFMWKRQAAHLFNWTTDTDSLVRTRTSTTPINAIDNSSTAVSAATPGYTIDLRYRSTVRRTTVPVTFLAYGSSAGTGGAVKLKDSTGTAVATISNITTAGWYSTTANLPATLAKYDLHYEGDGTNSFSFYAASLYQSASGT